MVISRLIVAVVVAISATVSARAQPQARPNVVIIYTDDLGYGDTSAYGGTAIKTPNIARLAKEGLRFTDAHSEAATCTPSRFALLTGEYAFRKPGRGVLPGTAALIIDPGRTTLASVFARAGYATGAVGKWHLGLGPTGGPDWNKEIVPGPSSIGFTYSFIMAATGDRVPTVFVENGRVVNLDPADPISVSYTTPVGNWPTGKDHPELLKMQSSHGHDQTIVNGIGRIGYMTGGKAALWKDEDMADVFTGKAVQFIEKHRDAPFFLYFATHDPHVPRVPHPRFVGRTNLGPRGDAVVEADWSVGRILETLDRLGLTGNTLLIFTSDNGPVVDDGYRDGAKERLSSHKPWGPFRGGKYSTFEAGTRVPFIVRWPGRVNHGDSDALVSQVDFLASFAAFTKQPLDVDAGPDSVDTMAAFLGQSKQGRESVIEEAGGVALRRGQWKYIEPNKRQRISQETGIELGNSAEPQLYDLSKDPGEQTNLAAAMPDKVRELASELEGLKKSGRTRR
jgi:arylsulfatase A-like enzyme